MLSFPEPAGSRCPAVGALPGVGWGCRESGIFVQQPKKTDERSSQCLQPLLFPLKACPKNTEGR